MHDIKLVAVLLQSFVLKVVVSKSSFNFSEINKNATKDFKPMQASVYISLFVLILASLGGCSLTG